MSSIPLPQTWRAVNQRRLNCPSVTITLPPQTSQGPPHPHFHFLLHTPYVSLPLSYPVGDTTVPHRIQSHLPSQHYSDERCHAPLTYNCHSSTSNSSFRYFRSTSSLMIILFPALSLRTTCPWPAFLSPHNFCFDYCTSALQ